MSEPPDTPRCPDCGQPRDASASACPHCGSTVDPGAGFLSWLRALEDSRGAGVVLLLCLHPLQVFALFMPEHRDAYMPSGSEWIWLFGFTQALYALPAAVLCASLGKNKTALGVLFAAAMTLIVNLLVLLIAELAMLWA